MKLSVNILKQFLPQLDNDETISISNRLSSALSEVESVENVGKELDNIFAGEIQEIINHPKREALKIVTVKVNDKVLEIICGATNIKVGNIVPVCIIGGLVYNPYKSIDSKETFKIEEKKLGGITSEGMLCSERELGLGSDHSKIYLLPDQTQINTRVDELLYDTVIEIENKSLTHRPDCFSHEGIAREIAVQNNLKFVPSLKTQTPIQTSDKPLNVEVTDQINCKRYATIVISDIQINDSPLWLKTRLIATGLRPINNIVDISNYLMLELGQPSHAFDYDKIDNHKLILRQAEKGEKITTLDGVSRTLEEGMLVNADPKKIIGIAGVIGGKNTEVSSTTSTIILQVENFEMFNIRRTTRLLGLRTDASTRFEKGLDPNLVTKTLNKAADMIMDLAGGEIASTVSDIYPKKEKTQKFTFDLGRVKKYLGIDMNRTEVIKILTDLEITISPETLKDAKSKVIEKKDILELSIPSFRQDLKIEEDILEEIIRIHGYDKIPLILPTKTLKPPSKNKRHEVEKKIIRTLAASGSTQIYSYSFVGENLFKKANLDIKNNLKLKNPLSPELSVFRDTLLPSLLEKTSINTARYDNIDIFEISKTALKQIDEKTGLHIQPKLLCGMLSQKESKNTFRILKGKIDYLFSELGIENIKYENLDGSIPFKKAEIFHPQKTALIYANEEQIGLIGVINPIVTGNFELDENTVAYEINFDIISLINKNIYNFKKLYNQPEVKRDLSFWIKESIEAKNVIKHINDQEIPFLINFEIIDIYRDKHQKDKKSYFMEFILQSPTTTLSEPEITKSMEMIENGLKNTFKAEIRSE